MVPETVFYEAVAAIVDGQLIQLAELLKQYPTLPQARAPQPHHATLLHYAMANGVEDAWQRTPDNITQIVARLLVAGAAPDALAAWDGTSSPDHTPLIGLVTSYWPAQAGRQTALVHQLVQAGAQVAGLQGDQAPLGAAIAFGYLPAAEALVAAGASPVGLGMQAALGNQAALVEYFGTDGTLSGSRPRYTGPWLQSGQTSQTELDWAFVYACMHQQLGTAAFLLQKGADIAAKGHQGMTALHYAVWHGHDPVIDFLLSAKAPLEIRNDYGGTVLDFLCWVMTHQPNPAVDHMAYFYRLLHVGAQPEAVSPLPQPEAQWRDELIFHLGLQCLINNSPDQLKALLKRFPSLPKLRTNSPLPPYNGYFAGATLLHHLTGNPRPAVLPDATIAMMQVLLEAGAEVDAASGTGDWRWTALGLVASGVPALAQGMAYDMLDCLLGWGADPNFGEGIALYGGIIHAMTHPQLRALPHYLAQKGAKIDLAYAAAVGDLERMATYRTATGALLPTAYNRYRPAQQRQQAPTEAFMLAEALVYASLNGRKEAAEWLLDRGAPLHDAVPLHQEFPTPLLAAIWGNWPILVATLLKRGAKPTQKDAVHHSDALGWAQHLERPSLVPIIQAYLG